MRRKALLAVGLFAGLLAAMTSASAQDAGKPSEPAFAAAARLGRGINILGYDGIWEGGTNAPFRLSNLKMIRDAGFAHVRINFYGFKFMDDRNLLDEAVMKRMDNVIDTAVAAGLIPVIDEHDYGICQKTPEDCAIRLKEFWQQVASRYAGVYPQMVFEILNEPGGSMTPEFWNILAGDVLRIIRATNPDRTVIVASMNSDKMDAIEDLKLPADDRNLIVTVHYYSPFNFTHQGAPWSWKLKFLTNVEWGSDSDKAKVTADFDRVAQWARRERRPIYLGEFGVYEAAGLPRRARWLSFVTRAAERNGWAWAYWQFDHDFAAFDTRGQRWIPDVVNALTPRR